MKRLYVLIPFVCLLFIAACSHEKGPACQLCRKPYGDVFAYSDIYGEICVNCALTPEFTICHGCGEFSDYGFYEYECGLGYCYDCSQELLRQCGMCEEGPFIKNSMVHFPGYYICGNCAYEIALAFDTEDEVLEFIVENNVFWPEGE